MLFFEKFEQKQQYNGPARVGYSFTYSPQLNCSILFGGCKDNDVYLFDHKKKSWTSKSTSSSKKYPSFRKYHAACVIQQNSSLLICGGQDENGRSLDDFHQLSLKDFKWNSLIIQKESVPRQRHSLIPLSKSEVLLFGGVSLPYKDYLNDCWILTRNQLNRYQNKPEWESKKLQVRGSIPQGACFRQSTVLLGDRLYCGCQNVMNQDYAPIQLYCLQIRSKIWRKLEYKFVAHQLKLYKTVTTQNEEGIIISLHENQKGQNPKFFVFSQNSTTLNQLDVQSSSSLAQIEPFVGDNSWSGQVVCGGKGKRLFAARFWIEQREVMGSVEQYLIAIKNEQMLAQQLGKKNLYLQELYKEMQTYISHLNRSYQHYKRDENIDVIKEKHIEDCQYLKEEYTRLNTIYEQSSKTIRELRGQLSAIDEQFERCIETQFDQEA